MSSLRKYQKDPKHLLNTALTMFRSKKIRTAIVEGVCDKRFLSQWIKAESAIRFDGLDGKRLVNSVYINSRTRPYAEYDFLYFFADVDYDVLIENPLHQHPAFVYNAFCFEEGRLHYNDLESYLINTNAFEKVLVNLDIESSEAPILRDKLERASRFFGSLRAADLIVQRERKLRSSVLNGLEIRGFFNARDITADKAGALNALPRWVNYREYMDDLIETAERLDRESSLNWSLSRGHDLTEMLALHLESRGQRGITPERLEVMLRLACELSDFQNSPMGRRIASAWGMTAAATSCAG